MRWPFQAKQASRSRGRGATPVARQSASGRDVRRRQMAQRSRQFSQQMARIGGGVAQGWSWLPRLDWDGLRGIRWQAPGFSGWRASKLLSLALLVAVGSLLYQFQQDEFFIDPDQVGFVGQSFLSREELYPHFEMVDWHILWVDPQAVQAQIQQHPYVARASAEVALPAQIRVTVTEIDPVAIWNTEREVYWLLKNGEALPWRETGPQPDLRLVDLTMQARAPSAEGKLLVAPRLIETALALQDLFPNLDTVWYDQAVGLNFGIPASNTWVHWGDERRFDEKWLALQTVLPEVRADEGRSRIFNVTAPNRPFFRYYDLSETSRP